MEYLSFETMLDYLKRIHELQIKLLSSSVTDKRIEVGVIKYPDIVIVVTVSDGIFDSDDGKQKFDHLYSFYSEEENEAIIKKIEEYVAKYAK